MLGLRRTSTPHGIRESAGPNLQHSASVVIMNTVTAWHPPHPALSVTTMCGGDRGRPAPALVSEGSLA
jgi:hypothetical protein